MRGYTLLELLTSIAVVSILSAIAAISFMSYREKAQVAAAISEIQNIEMAIRSYYFDNNMHPASLTDIGQSHKKDPWGNFYVYQVLAGQRNATGLARKDRNIHPINTDYDLYSKGKDGKSASALTAKTSQDDIIRANNGGYIGLASKY
jgi:general secretion pathway protein G